LRDFGFHCFHILETEKTSKWFYQNFYFFIMQPRSLNAPANLVHYALKPLFHFFSEKLSSFIFKMDKNKCPKFFCEPTFFSGKGRISGPLLFIPNHRLFNYIQCMHRNKILYVYYITGNEWDINKSVANCTA
jgi:hypothetical protein